MSINHWLRIINTWLTFFDQKMDSYLYCKSVTKMNHNVSRLFNWEPINEFNWPVRYFMNAHLNLPENSVVTAVSIEPEIISVLPVTVRALSSCRWSRKSHFLSHCYRKWFLTIVQSGFKLVRTKIFHCFTIGNHYSPKWIAVSFLENVW